MKNISFHSPCQSFSPGWSFLPLLHIPSLSSVPFFATSGLLDTPVSAPVLVILLHAVPHAVAPFAQLLMLVLLLLLLFLLLLTWVWFWVWVWVLVQIDSILVFSFLVFFFLQFSFGHCSISPFLLFSQFSSLSLLFCFFTFPQNVGKKRLCQPRAQQNNVCVSVSMFRDGVGYKRQHRSHHCSLQGSLRQCCLNFFFFAVQSNLLHLTVRPKVITRQLCFDWP